MLERNPDEICIGKLKFKGFTCYNVSDVLIVKLLLGISIINLYTLLIYNINKS